MFLNIPPRRIYIVNITDAAYFPMWAIDFPISVRLEIPRSPFLNLRRRSHVDKFPDIPDFLIFKL